MFTSSLSESAYQEQFDDIRRSHRGYQDDDKTAQGPEGVQYWCADLPPARFLNSEGLVKSGETFKLTKAEALDLHKRFTSRFPDSLLSHMLAHRLVGIQWPWDCPKASRELRVWLGHARNMSLLVRTATLQYYSRLPVCLRDPRRHGAWPMSVLDATRQRSAFSCLRSDRAPLIFSWNIFSHFAAFSSANWADKDCPSVLTRAYP
jgi:hypothetical protein